jgi:prepilin-type N-terminal cleavage/methylation domain-containing protein
MTARSVGENMMPASRTQRKDEGFSLVEVMVAIVILTVGLLSLAQMMIVATHSNQLSGRMTSCSALAKEQLERLKAAPFYTNPAALTPNPILAPGPGGVDPLGATVGGYSQLYDPEGIPTAGAGMFEVRWSITDVATALPLAMKSIQVRCLAATGVDQFSIIGEARFTTFRTANVG